ncbi:MAG: hypothetical protein EKK42_08105 [Pseudonocardiaceae bacterium]|nr:MAG: hypothetical protein EKK42_08105 [Pseudonocardiaceae bacterium]
MEPRADTGPVRQAGRRRPWWITVATVAVLAAAGCSGAADTSTAGGTSRATYATAPCPDPIYPGVPQLDLGAGVECGYLTVPEDRSKEDGKTIRLAVARAKATAPNPKPDPLLHLAGGPGGSGLLGAAQRIAAGWNSDRDVIFMDQRGTWKSDPLLSCPEIDAFQADLVGLSTTDPTTAARSRDATKACRDRLAGAGWNLDAYRTSENAADIAAWDVPAAPGSAHVPTSSDRPVLILDGELDAITAPANGGEVARTVPNATRVLFHDSAHDAALWSPTCAVEIMHGFLADPATVDTRCAAATTPAAFTTSG